MIEKLVLSDLFDNTTFIIKMKNNDKPVSKSHLDALAKVYDLPESELMPFWLGEKVFHVLENSEFSIQALTLVLKKIKNINE